MNSNTIDQFDPIIQTTIRYFSSPNASLGDIASELGISKQAIHKRVNIGVEHLRTFRSSYSPWDTTKHEAEIKRQKAIIKNLQQQLIIKSSIISFFLCLREKILKFYPKFKVSRYSAHQKLYIIQMAEKFQRAGGTFKDFCKAINKSPETISSWQKRYKEKGFAGLYDKTTRPKNFGNKVPLKIKKYLVALFIRFPHWTDYQYHKYLRSNPEHSYYLSLPTIQKIRRMNDIKSELEKERIRKRWCFNQGTDVWTVDFTCILKTERYKLQLLTVSDARSRFLFKTALFLDTSTELVIDHLADLFIKYGKPTLIKADNGPEFRTDCESKLRDFSVYLLNNPIYYGQFNGAHERIHRALKTYIDKFEEHKNVTKLAEQINSFEDEYNYHIKKDYLEDRTPADVYYNDKNFIPQNADVVSPYEKDGELRMKFINRDNQPSRLSLPIILE
ncbi:MAG: DDE-type integrase/transposase/recombinase [Candidatus Brocadiales bacterium]|nr:DDE-type integrase/transposase/recombinase [Candidatus Brocadiales bacterium]